MNVNDVVAIVTGGASGLGLASVKRLAQNGAKVAIFDLNEEAGTSIAAELEGVLYCNVDVSNEASVVAGIDAAMSEYGKINAALNCAGIGIPMKTLGKKGPHTLDHFQKVISVNLIGSFNIIRLAAEKMALNEPTDDGERGVIINTASVAAFDGQKGQAAYSASKGGIVGMTLPIARDLASYGIRINTIAPGLFKTPILEGLSPEVVEGLVADIQFPKRLGDPAEYCYFVEHIITNPYLNAETIRLDAAIRMP